MSDISPAKLAASRANGAKSAGPRTSEGKSKVRFNALKHGLTAQIPVLPGEDQQQFDATVDGYKGSFKPCNLSESDLVEQIAQESWQIRRAISVEAARLTIKALTAADDRARQADEAAAILGQRLLFDRRGPRALYPMFAGDALKTSWCRLPDDPDEPSRLLARLESTSAGCRWLLERWKALRTRLEARQCWQSPEKFTAIRLLGHQPLDACEYDDVGQIFLACDAIIPHPKKAFWEIEDRVFPDDQGRLRCNLNKRYPARTRKAGPDQAWATLHAITDKAIDRLNSLLAIYQEKEARLAPLLVIAQGFDNSPEGERLRRYQIACDREYVRKIDTFIKLRKSGITQSDDPAPDNGDLPSADERVVEWPADEPVEWPADERVVKGYAADPGQPSPGDSTEWHNEAGAAGHLPTEVTDNDCAQCDDGATTATNSLTQVSHEDSVEPAVGPAAEGFLRNKPTDEDRTDYPAEPTARDLLPNKAADDDPADSPGEPAVVPVPNSESADSPDSRLVVPSDMNADRSPAVDLSEPESATPAPAQPPPPADAARKGVPDPHERQAPPTAKAAPWADPARAGGKHSQFRKDKNERRRMKSAATVNGRRREIMANVWDPPHSLSRGSQGRTRGNTVELVIN